MRKEKILKQKFKKWIRDIKTHQFAIFISIIMFSIASVLNIFAGRYATRIGSAVADDLILDIFPPINLNFIFIWGMILIIAVVIVYVFLFRINKFHLYLSHFSLLMLARSFAMCLTHLKTPADAIVVNWPSFLNIIAFQNDLFFSGHVAFSFIGFLLFKDSEIKWFFLVSLILMAMTVLLRIPELNTL